VRESRIQHENVAHLHSAGVHALSLVACHAALIG
jgi:hypothetical protein